MAPVGVRRLLFATAAGVTLIAGVAAAVQMMGKRAPTPPPGTEVPRAPRPPKIAPPPAATGVTPTTPEAGEPEASATAPSTPAAPPAPASSAARRSLVTGKHDGGPEEIQLLTRARAADVRGEYPDVLAILAEHERSHPAGRLSEEREVLRVKALVGLGRGSEARRAAARFRHQFPRSVLLQKIDEILASVP